MERPSRGARLSATTTRQTGSLRPPTRVSLIATAIVAKEPSGRSAPALAHHRPDVGHLALLQAAHQLAHLAELLDELVDLLHGGAGAGGDAGPAAPLDDVRPPPLLLGHREDDRLDAVELLLVDLHLRELVAGEPGEHPEQRRERPHLADLLELTQEVVE